jgi:hypothetical protein
LTTLYAAVNGINIITSDTLRCVTVFTKLALASLSVAFYKMIFPIWILKCVKNIFGMENDQRVIIKLLWSEGGDSYDVIERPQA